MTPKILLFDVETSYITVRVWRTGKQYISHDMIVDGQRTDIICLAYKWLGEKKVHTMDWGIQKQDSRKLIKEFSEIVSQADIVVGHNVDSFDLKQVNTQRFLHGEPPILWPQTQDTLKQLRKHFTLPSNRLDYVCKTLFQAGKDKMTMSDWVDIVERKDPEALSKMIRYNVKDVLLLEKLFIRLRPFMTPKPIKKVLQAQCPSCFSHNTHGHGTRFNRGAVRERRVCQKCGHVFIGEKI